MGSVKTSVKRKGAEVINLNQLYFMNGHMLQIYSFCKTLLGPRGGGYELLSGRSYSFGVTFVEKNYEFFTHAFATQNLKMYHKLIVYILHFLIDVTDSDRSGEDESTQEDRGTEDSEDTRISDKDENGISGDKREEEGNGGYLL